MKMFAWDDRVGEVDFGVFRMALSLKEFGGNNGCQRSHGGTLVNSQ